MENKETQFDSGEVNIDESQTSFLPDTMEETPIKLDIDYQEPPTEEGPFDKVETENMTQEDEGEEVPRNTKMKVIAAIGILVAAGYLAYWVQEPVEIQADLIAQADTETEEISGPVEDIDLSLFGFDPAVLTIDSGTTVRWTNTSSEVQTIIGEATDGTSFSSPELESGDTYTYTFDSDAEVEYYSTYNPALKALLTVGEGEVVIAETEDETEATDVLESTIEDDATVEDLFGAAEEVDDSKQIVEPIAETIEPITEIEPIVETEKPIIIAEANAAPTGDMTSGRGLTESDLAGEAIDDFTDLKGAAPGEMSDTGPEHVLYALVFGAILYFNRKKLAAFTR